MSASPGFSGHHFLCRLCPKLASLR
ncbi:hypothetical protein LINPERHAP1_LOCUS41086 [Linum perenne]